CEERDRREKRQQVRRKLGAREREEDERKEEPREQHSRLEGRAIPPSARDARDERGRPRQPARDQHRDEIPRGPAALVRGGRVARPELLGKEVAHEAGGACRNYQVPREADGGEKPPGARG